MQKNDNQNAATGDGFRVASTLSHAETVDDIVRALWRLSGGSQGAWTLSHILALAASLVGGEQISREDRDRILVAIGVAQENHTPAMFDPEGVGRVVDDGVSALAAIVVWLEQDYLARGTREPTEIETLLARAQLCRLEMDAVVRRADRTQHPRRSVDACGAAR